MLFGTRFTDLCYGYNAFWRRVLPALDLPSTDLPRPADGSKLWGDGFEIETLINIRVAACGFRIAEVPSLELERIHGESNLHAVRDGQRVLRTILSEYRTRRSIKAAAIARGLVPSTAPVTTAARRASAADSVAPTSPAPAPQATVPAPRTPSGGARFLAAPVRSTGRPRVFRLRSAELSGHPAELTSEER
jgi:hypothetical protein